MAEPAFVLTSSSGQAQPTDLAAPIAGAGDTSFTVTSAGSWLESHGANVGSPLGTTGPFTVVVDAGVATEEHIYCSAVNVSTGVVTVYNVGGFLGRGYDGTNAVAHSTSSGTGYVYPILTSKDAQEANLAAVAIGKATTAGDTLYATGAQTFARRAIGTTGQVYTVVGGLPTWAGSGQLIPTAKSGNYNAVAGDFVEMTGQFTVTLPNPGTVGRLIGVQSENGTGAAPCTVTTGAGAITGPGIPAATASILLGAVDAFVVLSDDGTDWNVVAGAQDSGWITPALGNSWVASGGFTAPQYRKVGNTVRMIGVTDSGAANSSPFTLPAGYRPSQGIDAIPMVSSAVGTRAVGGISVPTSGVFTIYYSQTLGCTCPLTSVTFLVD